MVTIHKVEQGSPEWHALRAGLITASNAGALLLRGVNAAALANTGQSVGGTNYWAARGHILEHEAVDIYQQVKGVTINLAGFITNDRYPNCGYSPDGWEPLLEVKCFAEAKHLKSCADTPFEVYAQVQFGMMVAEKDSTDVIFYNPDLDDPSQCFKVVTVARDQKVIDRFEKILGVKE